MIAFNEQPGYGYVLSGDNVVFILQFREEGYNVPGDGVDCPMRERRAVVVIVVELTDSSIVNVYLIARNNVSIGRLNDV